MDLSSRGPIRANRVMLGRRWHWALLAMTSVALSGASQAQASVPDTSANKAEIVLPIDDVAQRAAGIGTGIPEPDRQGQDLRFPGSVVVPPHQASVVASPASGMVDMILVAQDEHVKAGQKIARMRSPQVIEAQHQLIAALTDERLAADKLRRTQSLFEVKAMSEVQFVMAQGELAHAQARVEERTQILSLMGIGAAEIETLRKTRRISNVIDIVAPADGTIITRSVTQGARVDAATPLFTIATLSPLWVNIQVPVAQMSAVKEGSMVTLPAQGAKGRVIRIGRTIDPATQSVGAVAEVDINGGSVRPGLAVTVSVRTSNEVAARWSVPVASVVRHRGRSWIFVKTDGGFRAKPVEVVHQAGQRIVLDANVTADDRIATQGVLALAAELAESDER